MSTRIRLRRMGANKRPFYRVVVADQRSPRDGRFIEIIGKYHPLEDPSLIEIDEERALHWLRVGAQPSNQVRNLMNKIGIWDRFVAERPGAAIPPKPQAERPIKAKLSKKASAKAADEAKAEAAAPEAAAPEVPAPEVPAPEAAAPEVAAPEVAAPATESSDDLTPETAPSEPQDETRAEGSEPSAPDDAPEAPAEG